MTVGTNIIPTNRIRQDRRSTVLGDHDTQQMRCRRGHSESSVARSLNDYVADQTARCSFSVRWLHGLAEPSRSLLGVPAQPAGSHRRSERRKVCSLKRLRQTSRQTAMKDADSAGITVLDAQYCWLSNRAVARSTARGTLELSRTVERSRDQCGDGAMATARA